MYCSSWGKPTGSRQHPSIASRVQSNLAAVVYQSSYVASCIPALWHSFCSALKWGWDTVKDPVATLDAAFVYLGIKPATKSSKGPPTTIFTDTHSYLLDIAACATAFITWLLSMRLAFVKSWYAAVPCARLLWLLLQACSCPNMITWQDC